MIPLAYCNDSNIARRHFLKHLLISTKRQCNNSITAMIALSFYFTFYSKISSISISKSANKLVLNEVTKASFSSCVSLFKS